MRTAIEAAGAYGRSTGAGFWSPGIRFFEWFGDMAAFWGRILGAMLSPPWEFRELIRQCDLIGSGSLPLVALAGAATGVVMSLQMLDSLAQFGARSLLPAGTPEKKFVYFEKPDVAELKHEKALNQVGLFLQQSKFGLAVVAAHTGMKGDTQQDRSLTEAQSMVVRDYLAKNFKFDDTRLKTIGLGKDADGTPNNDTPNQVEILVYAPETPAPGPAAK